MSDRAHRLGTRGGALVVAVIGALAATTVVAQHATPTPGPAERAGAAIDRTWTSVSADVAEALLVSRIRIALLEHLKQDGLGVHIDAAGDVVTLSGTVERRSSQELAEEVARSISGVRSVKNRIALEVEQAPGAKAKPIKRALKDTERELKDALLETRVKARLIDQLGRVAFAIEVEATDGVVSLAGTVPDHTRRELARDVAKATSGVIELHDLLHVQ